MATLALTESVSSTEPVPSFFLISLKKLLILQLCTLGWYSVYWWFKQWQCYLHQEVHPHRKHRLAAAGLTLLTYFYCYRLFEKVDENALKSHIEHRWEPVVTTLTFAGCGLLLIIAELLDIEHLLIFGVLLKIIMVACQAIAQHTMNQLYQQQTNLTVVSPFTRWNKALFVVAPFLWLLLLFGITYESTSNITKAKIEISEQHYAYAYELLEEPAERGIADAQFLMGYLYFYGYGIPQSYQKAYRWFNRAALQDNNDAKFFLGLMYDTGNGTPKDVAKAIDFYQQAANHSVAGALYELSNHYYSGDGVTQDTSRALTLLQQAADQGFVYAAYQLGSEYYNGDNMPQDYQQAAFWYQKAADKGHIYAKTNLAFLYAKGYGVSQDRQKALTLYREAAAAQDAVAMYNIGLSYFEGNGVTQDYQQARDWYLKSAEGNITCAFNDLGIIYASGKGIPADAQQATRWFKKAAIYEHQDNESDASTATVESNNAAAAVYATYMLNKYRTDHQSLTPLSAEQETASKTLADLFERQCWQ